MSTPRLDPEAQALLEAMRASGAAQPYALPVEEAREQMRAALVTRGTPAPLHRVEDISLPAPHGALAMRLYRPAEDASSVALFLHGGGWTLNDLDTHDSLCRRIARRSGWVVAALDYRRAPEHKHPAALEDAHFAYRWILENPGRIGVERSRVAVMGESSGATTAACLTLLLRDGGHELPVIQALVYPITDMYDRWPSYRERGSGYTLDREIVLWSFSNYAPSLDGTDDPYLVPLAARDLSGLPPTFIMTAEFDPLRDEGIAYAQRLAQAGVEVEHVHVEDQMHGFLLVDRAVPKAGVLIDRLADALSAHARRSVAGAGFGHASAVIAGGAQNLSPPLS
jgi:acetyl esterase